MLWSSNVFANRNNNSTITYIAPLIHSFFFFLFFPDSDRQVPVTLLVTAANRQTIHAATTATRPATWPAIAQMAIAKEKETVMNAEDYLATIATKVATFHAIAQMARSRAIAAVSWVTSAVNATKTAAATKGEEEFTDCRHYLTSVGLIASINISLSHFFFFLE